VLGRLPEPVRQGLTATTRLALVPASWDAALAKAIAQELGDAATRAVARASMLQSLRGPLLGGLGSGVLRLFGMQPGRFFRWADKAWGHVTKGCGDLEAEVVEDSSAILALRGMPHSLAIPEYLTYVAGTLESIFDLCRVTGTVAESGRPDGARFTASWRAGAPDG
jgi:hypothetical protein